MAAIKLVAESRTEFGKGAARRIRRDNKIPAVLYGHGGQPLHVTLPGHESMLALRQSNALLNIVVDGKRHLTVAKDIQRDPVRDVIEHIDLQVVRAGEKITVDINVIIVGESAPGTIHLVEEQSLSVEAEATHLPESVEVSIEGLEAGSQIHAGDVELPTGVSLLTDPEYVVVLVTEPRGEATPDAESADSADSAGSAAEAPADS